MVQRLWKWFNVTAARFRLTFQQQYNWSNLVSLQETYQYVYTIYIDDIDDLTAALLIDSSSTREAHNKIENVFNKNQ